MDLQEARKLFPCIQSGQVYFNHAGTGPLSLRVLEEIKAALKESSEGKIDDYPGFVKISESTKQLLADYLNTDSSSIAFLDNTTNGLNLLAQGVEWRKGDRVLLNDIEFPANVYPFLNLQSYGVEADFVKSHDGIVSADDIISSVKKETRLISVSQVQFLSGYRIDLKKLGKFCRDNGIIFCVDAIQGLGAFPIDVNNEYVDFISCGTQKWMLALQGLAFIYVSAALRQKLKPKYIGWLSVEDAWDLLDYKTVLSEDAGKYQTGTVNSLGIKSLNASIKLLIEFGTDRIKERVIKNTLILFKLLDAEGIKPMLQGCSEENLSGILSFKTRNSRQLFDKLTEQNIHTSFKEGYIRLSPHFYNNEEDFDKFITAVRKFKSAV